jgi:hypothetical protein
MTIVERTEEYCIRTDNHGQKIQEASEASCRMLQVDRVVFPQPYGFVFIYVSEYI